MGFVKEEGICPVCKKKAVITRKWVLNKYKKKYSYFIYHHDGTIHYTNQSADHSRAFRKGELERLLLETINSEKFKLGLFSTIDIVKILARSHPDIEADSIRYNLYRLTEIGILDSVKKGRHTFFLSATYKERLSFVAESIKIVLEDLDDDHMYKGHVSTNVFKNDKGWPLYYLPYKILGDTDAEFKDLKFKAYDISFREELRTFVIEDNSKEKRLLLSLNKPLLPNEKIKVRFEYRWPEPKGAFFFSAATKMNSFNFVLHGNDPLKVQASLTTPAMNDVKDLSTDTLRSKNQKWKFIYSWNLKTISPFTMIQFKWKLVP